MIESLSEAIKTKNDEIKSDINKVIKVQEDIVETYSEKVKKKESEPVVVIKPKDNKQKSDDTRKEVKSSFDPTKIAVSGIKNARDGGVIIECKSKLAAETLKAEAQTKIGEKYNISELKKQLPRVKIIGITENLKPEEIIDLLHVQNEDIIPREKEIKVIHVASSKKNQRNYLAYVQMDADCYYKVLKAGKVNTGWDKCPVYDAGDVPICYKCCGFNHIAKNCNRQVVCGRCGNGHSTYDCKVAENEAICVNCKYAVEKLNMKKIDYHHSTWSKECQAYLRNLEVRRVKLIFYK